MRLAGVAIGVRKEAHPATAMSMRIGCTETPVSTAAETAMGTTMRVVAVLLIHIERAAVAVAYAASTRAGSGENSASRAAKNRAL